MPFLPRKTRMKKGGKLRSRSKSPRAKLIREADRVLSLYKRQLIPYCVTCGTTENLTCSHFYKRSYLAIRWDERNLVTQCADCNLLHNTNPWPYLNYLLDTLPEGTLQELHELRMNRKIKVSNADIEAIISKYRPVLKRAA